MGNEARFALKYSLNDSSRDPLVDSLRRKLQTELKGSKGIGDFSLIPLDIGDPAGRRVPVIVLSPENMRINPEFVAFRSSGNDNGTIQIARRDISPDIPQDGNFTVQQQFAQKVMDVNNLGNRALVLQIYPKKFEDFGCSSGLTTLPENVYQHLFPEKQDIPGVKKDQILEKGPQVSDLLAQIREQIPAELRGGIGILSPDDIAMLEVPLQCDELSLYRKTEVGKFPEKLPLILIAPQIGNNLDLGRALIGIVSVNSPFSGNLLRISLFRGSFTLRGRQTFDLRVVSTEDPARFKLTVNGTFTASQVVKQMSQETCFGIDSSGAMSLPVIAYHRSRMLFISSVKL